MSVSMRQSKPLVCWLVGVTFLICLRGDARAAENVAFVEKGSPRGVTEVGAKWKQAGSHLDGSGTGNYLIGAKTLGAGDFHVGVRLSIAKPDSTAASLMIGANHFGFDGQGRKLFVEDTEFGRTRLLGDATKLIEPGKPFDAEVVRIGDTLTFLIDGTEVHRAKYHLNSIPALAVRPWRADVRVYEFSASGKLLPVRDGAAKKIARPAPASARRRSPPEKRDGRIGKGDLAALRMAIEDLGRTFPDKYTRGAEFLARLDKMAEQGTTPPAEFTALKREALLANPLLDFERLLIIRRRIGRDATRFDGGMWGFNSRSLGIPDTGSGNTILPRKGFDNEIAVLSPVRPDGPLATLYKPKNSVFVGDVDLHWDAEKMLFSSLDAKGRWQIFEMGLSGKPPRQVARGQYADVDNYDPCYLPDGGIVFGSTRSFQRVPCRSTMQTPIALLYRMDADGTHIRQLTFDQDHNWCPTVLPNGRVMYLRWEYSGIPHGASRILFHMNPDGTGQTAYYGSNSHWPNCVFFARAVPGPAGQFVMGDATGPDDERPPARVSIDKPFWTGKFEVTNRQFARFDPKHDSRWIKGPGLQYSSADRGWRVNGPQQPVVRVSWLRAMAFCRWLSEKTGQTFTLPTEAQWEYACRAGTDTPLWYGGTDADFSKVASLADGTLTRACFALRRKSLHHTTPVLQTLVRPAFSDKGNDGAIVSTNVGRVLPNPWGLGDMHGNAAEWTRSTYRPYPYRPGDGRNDPTPAGRKVVRGGSFHDRPTRSRSASRLSYPPWRRVFNTGFRVICPASAVR